MFNKMVRLALVGLAALVVSAGGAAAQSSCPTFSYGIVLTAGQWQACFDAKQNNLGYTPVNKAGDVMTGRLVTTSSTTLAAGFNIFPGVAPVAPTNGDLWTTSAGLFARINGATIGPIGGNAATQGAVLAPARVATTAAITLSGIQTVDSVLLAANDRVLVGRQADLSTNGCYVVASGAWSRCTDFAATGQVVNGTQIYVTSGTVNGRQNLVVLGTNPITIGTTQISFGQVGESGDIVLQPTGADDESTLLSNGIIAANAAATNAVRKVRWPNDLGIATPVSHLSNVAICDSSLIVRSTMPLTAAALSNPNVPSDHTTRTDQNIVYCNMTTKDFRVYPSGGGTIGNLWSYEKVANLQFYDNRTPVANGSFTLVELGGLNPVFRNNSFEGCGSTTGFTTQCLYSTAYGSFRVIVAISQAAEATVTTDDASPFVDLQAITLVDQRGMTQLADGDYDIHVIDDTHFQIGHIVASVFVPIDSSGFDSFVYTGRTLVEQTFTTLSENAQIIGTNCLNTNRNCITVGGRGARVLNTIVKNAGEGGIYVDLGFDPLVDGSRIDGVVRHSLVGDGIEENNSVGLTVTNNNIANTDTNSIAGDGCFGCIFANNFMRNPYAHDGTTDPAAKGFLELDNVGLAGVYAPLIQGNITVDDRTVKRAQFCVGFYSAGGSVEQIFNPTVTGNDFSQCGVNTTTNPQDVIHVASDAIFPGSQRFFGNQGSPLDQYLVPNGSVSAPSYAFYNQPRTGMYLASESPAVTIGFAIQGSNYLALNNSALFSTAVAFRAAVGSVTHPGLSFAAQDGDGFYDISAGVVGGAAAGVNEFTFGGGFIVGAPTGSFKGVGTFNAPVIYLNGTALGTASVQNVGTSGATVPLLNAANTWGATQVMTHLTVEGVTSTGAQGTGNFVFATGPSMSAVTVTGSFTATGLVTVADLVSPSTTVNGQTCTLGSGCTVTAAATSITVNTTNVLSSTNTNIMRNSGGVLGEYTISGSGTVVAMAAGAALTGATFNGNTWTAGTGTLAIGAGKTLTASNTLTFTGTDGSSVNVLAGGTISAIGYGNSGALANGSTATTQSAADNSTKVATTAYADAAAAAVKSGQWPDATPAVTLTGGTGGINPTLGDCAYIIPITSPKTMTFTCNVTTNASLGTNTGFSIAMPNGGNIHRDGGVPGFILNGVGGVQTSANLYAQSGTAVLTLQGPLIASKIYVFTGDINIQ